MKNKKSILSCFLIALIILCYSGICLAQEVKAEDPQAKQITPQQIEANQISSILGNKTDSNSNDNDKKISMDFKDADIKDVLRIVSDKSGINIIAGGEVQGVVTMKLESVPWDKALDIILKTQGYVYEQDGNIIRVTTRENLSMEDLETTLFSLSYADAESLTTSLADMLSARGNIQFDARTNQVIVTDIGTNIKKLASVIEQLDGRTPQIQIEARVIETTLGKDETLGVDWQTEIVADGAKRATTLPFSNWSTDGRLYPTPDADYTYDASGQITDIVSDFAIKNDLPVSSKDAIQWSSLPAVAGDTGEEEYFQYGTLDFTGLQATLEALSTRTDTNVLSNPRITTLNNKEAKITVGTKWPVANYSYSDETGRWNVSGWEYIEYGIIMTVTPTVNKDGYITLSVVPEVSDLTGSVTFEGAEVPIISTKQAEVEVMIKDGETLVIGGMIKDKVVNTNNKIPFLGDIPILGYLFSQRGTEIEKRDLLIFLTPHVLKENGHIDSVSTVAFEQETVF
ncbi:MAG: type IV pilus secretin PilQ [Candidatus Kappaea frigidicola]|nr:type IV pilus secretin PilQ [Candidatus Kappaea frigidicola]